MGVTRLTLLAGVILAITALAGLFSMRKAGSIVAVIALLALPVLAGGDTADPAQGLFAVEQSPYAEIRVIDKDGIRHLLIDGGIHSMIDTATGESFHRYTAVMNIPKYFYASPGNMLLIGLGGGTLVREYAASGWSVEAVQIDETVIAVAEKYFGIGPQLGTIHAMDGRPFSSRVRMGTGQV